MIVTISQPRYLPWLGYFERLAGSDVAIHLDCVQYTPRDWENRNRVKTDRGFTWLTVPVNARYRALIPEVRIDDGRPWQQKHWRTIETYYAAAPHFAAYADRLRPVYTERRWSTLVELNLALTGILADALGLPPLKVVRASEVEVPGRGSELILNLCRALGATTYFSGAEGRNYLDEAAFATSGISVVYQQYRHPVYPQLHGPFEPAMAAIDLLFNCGPDSLAILSRGGDGQPR